MKIRYYLLLLLTNIFLVNPVFAQQNLKQTIRGVVVDKETQIPLPGVNLVITNTQPQKGTISDESGK